MGTPYHRYHDQMQSVIDSISHDSDPLSCLNNFQRLSTDFRRAILAARDQAAYDLRTRYSSEDAEILAGVSRRYIDYWARRCQRKNGLPPLKQKKRTDLSGVVDLSDGGRFPTNPRR